MLAASGVASTLFLSLAWHPTASCWACDGEDRSQPKKTERDNGPHLALIRPHNAGLDPGWALCSGEDQAVACSGVGITPSCCIMLSWSNRRHVSTIIPPTIWSMVIADTTTCFPVGGMPIRSPV